MKNYYVKYIVGLFFIFLLSCSQENKKIKDNLSQIIGQKVQLIDSLRYYSQEKGFYKDSIMEQLKIITFIDGGCGSCLYDLEKWKEIVALPKLKDIRFLFYVKCYNRNQLISVIKEINFTYPIIIDTSNQFYKVNNLKSDKTYQTFLVDKKNNILLVGNPLYSLQIKSLYLNTLAQFITPK